jgi:ribosome-binding factor A
MPEYRKKRIENLIREQISSMILLKEIKDPRVQTFLSVTNIHIAGDLSTAKIGISSFQEPNTVQKAVDGLNHAAGYIQHLLGKRMHTRSTPVLTFYQDKGIKEGFEIMKKLKDLNS